MSKAYFEEPRRGPITLEPSSEPLLSRGNTIPASGPANPRQRVRNDRRDPEPYVDLRVRPSLTGTWFEKEGRYRLFINHVGGHLEGLLTLVVRGAGYHTERKSLEADERLPFDWGIAGFLGKPKKRKYDPIAFRFAGDHVGGTYVLTVPVWLGDKKIPMSATTDGTYDVGFLEARSGNELVVSWLGWFVDRWPEADRVFGVSSGGTSTTVENLETVALRSSAQPVLLDRYLARKSVPYHVRTQYWFPLTPQQRDNLVHLAAAIYSTEVHIRTDMGGFALDEAETKGTPMDIYDLLMAERSLGMTHIDGDQRDDIVTAIDHIVYKVFESAYTTPPERGGLGIDELMTLRPYVLRALDGWMLEASEGHGRQSMATALQRTVDRASMDFTNYSHLEKYLGIKPRGWRKFRYEVEVVLFELLKFEDETNKEIYGHAKKLLDKLRKSLEDIAGKNFERFGKFKDVARLLPLTYLVGHVQVKYLGVVDGDTGGPQDEPWKASYGIALGGLLVDKSAGTGGAAFTLSGPAEQWAATPPTKEDLEGTASYVEGKLFAGMKMDGGKGGIDDSVVAAKSMLTFFGSAQEPSVSFVFTGKMSKGAGVGVGVQTLAGISWLLEGEDSRIELEPKGKREEEAFKSYWQDHVPSLAVHFPINGARLPVPTEKERERMQEESMISVKEALDAFAACELPLIANPAAQIEIDGYADPPGKPKDNEELSLNRATSIFNYLHGILDETLTFGLPYESLKNEGRLTYSGHGEPPPPATGSPKTTGPEEFDPAERRVDIAISLRTGQSGIPESIEPETPKPIKSLSWSLRRSG